MRLRIIQVVCVVLFLMVLGSIFFGCTTDTKVSWNPPIIPVTVSVDLQGNVRVDASSPKLSLGPLGTIKAGVVVSPAEHFGVSRTLTVRIDGQDHFYQLEEDINIQLASAYYEQIQIQQEDSNLLVILERSTGKSTVAQTVIRFNTDQTVAVHLLDADMLIDTASDSWLAYMRNYIDGLRRENLYEIQQQLAFEVVDVSITGATATAITHEKWQTKKLDLTTQACRFHQPAFITEQTYTLRQIGDRWKITDIDFDAPPDQPGC